MVLQNPELNGSPIGQAQWGRHKADIYRENDDLPEDEASREVCLIDFDLGALGEAEVHFLAKACHVPRRGEEPIIRYQAVCPGQATDGSCQLRIAQYDSHGSEIAQDG